MMESEMVVSAMETCRNSFPLESKLTAVSASLNSPLIRRGQ
jgi:hypothetical protein